MKKKWIALSLLLGVCFSADMLAQSPVTKEKMSVADRMAKARATKADKRNQPADKSEKATAADYKTPVDKVVKGPNGEAVHMGERGGKYYINKNGNKTYLSSNQ